MLVNNYRSQALDILRVMLYECKKGDLEGIRSANRRYNALMGETFGEYGSVEMLNKKHRRSGIRLLTSAES